MAGKEDLRRIALSMEGVRASDEDPWSFSHDGRVMITPYRERVHPKKAKVRRYDMYVVQVADDKEALLQGEPDVFFTTDHYNGYASVIMRLDALDEDRLTEIVQEAWEATS